MDGIRQHKTMAAGGKVAGEGGNFGVEPFHAVNGGHETMPAPKGHEMPHGHNAAMMHDHERGIGAHVPRGKGMMPGQRHPDHGPHHHADSFGVASLKSVNG